MISYSEKLRDPRWQKKRLEVFERSEWKCDCCLDDKETLHVHHMVYGKGEPWETELEHLESLCETCHEFRENFNGFWGRSKVPAWFCLSFEWIFRSLFEGKEEFGRIGKSKGK